MKYLLIAALACMLSIPLRGQDRGLGIGILLGEPTGLSAKLWTSQEMALDAGLAWSFSGIGYLRVHTDLLWHREVFDVDTGSLPIYYGLGAKLLLASDLGMGIRIPVGIVYYFEHAPVDLFVELVPGLDLFPETALDIDLAIGARYFL